MRAEDSNLLRHQPRATPNRDRLSPSACRNLCSEFFFGWACLRGFAREDLEKAARASKCPTSRGRAARSRVPSRRRRRGRSQL